MKSFRLYTSPKLMPPLREAASYSRDEVERLIDDFKDASSIYHRLRRITKWSFGAFVVGILLILLLPKSLFPWLLVPILLFWLIGFGAVATLPPLVCPGCGNDIERQFGVYCPECGCRDLHRVPPFGRPLCAACGKCMRKLKGQRQYKIRVCTHCGLMLDEQGL